MEDPAPPASPSSSLSSGPICIDISATSQSATSHSSICPRVRRPPSSPSPSPSPCPSLPGTSCHPPPRTLHGPSLLDLPHAVLQLIASLLAHPSERKRLRATCKATRDAVQPLSFRFHFDHMMVHPQRALRQAQNDAHGDVECKEIVPLDAPGLRLLHSLPTRWRDINTLRIFCHQWDNQWQPNKPSLQTALISELSRWTLLRHIDAPMVAPIIDAAATATKKQLLTVRLHGDVNLQSRRRHGMVCMDGFGSDRQLQKCLTALAGCAVLRTLCLVSVPLPLQQKCCERLQRLTQLERLEMDMECRHADLTRFSGALSCLTGLTYLSVCYSGGRRGGFFQAELPVSVSALQSLRHLVFSGSIAYPQGLTACSQLTHLSLGMPAEPDSWHPDRTGAADFTAELRAGLPSLLVLEGIILRPVMAQALSLGCSSLTRLCVESAKLTDNDLTRKPLDGLPTDLKLPNLVEFQLQPDSRYARYRRLNDSIVLPAHLQWFAPALTKLVMPEHVNYYDACPLHHLCAHPGVRHIVLDHSHLVERNFRCNLSNFSSLRRLDVYSVYAYSGAGSSLAGPAVGAATAASVSGEGYLRPRVMGQVRELRVLSGVHPVAALSLADLLAACPNVEVLKVAAARWEEHGDCIFPLIIGMPHLHTISIHVRYLCPCDSTITSGAIIASMGTSHVTRFLLGLCDCECLKRVQLVGCEFEETPGPITAAMVARVRKEVEEVKKQRPVLPYELVLGGGERDLQLDRF